MKLRLPHKFQAALIAAIASVSITTLSTGTAYAETLTQVATMSDLVTSATVGTATKSTIWEIAGSVVYDFDRSTDCYLGGISTVDLSTALNNGNYVTVAAWINSPENGVPNNGHTIFGYGGQNDGIKVVDESGKLKMTTKNVADFGTSSKGIDLNQWELVAITFHKNGGKLDVQYMLDGSYSATVDGGYMNAPAGQTFAIGSGNGSDSRELFVGSIAGLTVYTSSNWVSATDVSDAMFAKPTEITYTSQTWDGNDTNHSWSDTVWLNGGSEEHVAFNNGNAEFGATGNKTVLVNSAVTAHDVIVSGQGYTFSLQAGGNLTANSLTINGDATGLTIDSGNGATGTLKVNSAISASGKTITVNNGAVLQVATTGSSFTLAGNGTYALADGVYAKDNGVTIGSNWTGTVLVSNTASGTNNQVNDVALTNGNQSTLELSGFKGWLANNRWKAEVGTNIKLTDYVNGNTTRYAWVSEAYSTSSTDTMTLTGKWSGTGTYNAAGTNGGARYMHYNFKGDITGWTGAFLKTSQDTVRTNLTFSENAKNVNIRIEGTGNFGVIVNTAATFSQAVTADTFTVNANMSAKLNGATVVENGITLNTGSSLTVGATGSLRMGGTVTFAHAPVIVEDGGTVSFANTVVFDLDTLDAVQQDNKWVYTLFTGSDVTMSGLSASNLSITGGTLGKNWDFTTPNQISYTLKPEKEWTKDVAAYWNYTDPNWNGQQFNEGDAAVFNLGENVVWVNAAVKASSIKLAPEGGGSLMLGAVEGGSLSAANISVESTGANLLTSIEITGVEEFSVGEGAVWGITANQTLGAGTNNGTISIGKGNTLTLTDGATAAALLQSVQGSGNIRLTADTDLEGVLNDKEHASRTQATGTLTLQGITLRLGKMSTDGSYQKWYVDLSSFDTIALDGGTLWVHSPETVVNNVTVDNHAGTIHVRDSDNDQQAGKPDTLKIAGKLTLNANLTISSTWKNKVSIAELAGTGKLTLSGGNNQVINIGGGTVGSMELSTAQTHATVTGNLTVSSGDLTLRSGDLSVSGSVAVNKALDLSAGGDSNATLNIKSGGTVTLANTSNASFWLDDSAHLNLEQNGTLNLEKYHVSIAGRANGSSIVAATNNQQYGTNNTNFTVTNADVTALGTITLANKLVNSTINTGAYAVTLTNGGNVLAGATVGAGGTLNINANSTLLASISNESQVTFTSGVTVTMDASMVQDGAVGYLDTGDAFTGDGNGFKTERIGKFVTVITGPGSVTANNIVVNAGSDVLYLNNRGVAFIEGAVETVTYDTYYQKSGVADLSDIIAMAGGNTVHTVQVGANTQLNLNGYVKTVNSIGETSVEDCAIINLQDGGKVSDVVTQTAMTAVVGDLSINGTDTPDTQGNATQLHMNKSNSLAVVGNVNVDSKVRFVKGGDEGVVLVTSIDSQTGAQYTLDKATMMVASDKVQKVAEGDVEVANYTSSRVVDNTEASGSFTLSNASLAMQALEEVHAVTGDISFLNTGNQYEPTLKALVIAGGKTVSFNQAGSIEAMATETTVTVTGTLKAGKDATLNANLVMGSKSTLDVSGTGGAGLLMGSSVTLNPGVTLSGDDMDAITALGFMDQYTLFTGVDAFSYDGTISFDSKTWVKASEVFSNDQFKTGEKDYYVFYSGAQNGSNVGAVYVMQLPEPTTGTLSLLALAALAARRRRK